MKSILILLATAATSFGGESELIAVLQSNAEQYEKFQACRQLAATGTKDAVPVLAKLLADEKMSHMARFALEAMPDPAAGAALRDALGTLHGNQLIGVINSLGMRRDAQASESLAKILANDNGAVAEAAAAALGRIGNATALKSALAKTPSAAIADACLVCAEQLNLKGDRAAAIALYDLVRKTELPVQLRQAALQGAILARREDGIALLVEQLKGTDFAMTAVALRAARMLPGTKVTKILAAELPQLTPETKVLLIRALGDRGDVAAATAVTEAAKIGVPPVRLAAVRALGRLGNASVVPVLLDAASQPDAELAKAAQTSLAALPGKEVAGALVRALDNAPVRRVAIEAVAQRRLADAVPGLLRAASDADAATRLAAIKALGETVPVGEFGALVNLLVKANSAEEQTAAQNALASACARLNEREACAGKLVAPLPQAAPAVKLILLQLLAQAGGARSLQAVRTATTDANTEIREAALRSLCDWATPDALADLAKLAQTSTDNKIKILALRGQLRLIPMQTVGAEQKLAQLKAVLPLIERTEEKRLALAALGDIPTADALALVVPELGRKELQEEASVAAVAIAGKIASAQPGPVAAAMQQVLKVTANKQLAKTAKSLLDQAAKQ